MTPTEIVVGLDARHRAKLPSAGLRSTRFVRITCCGPYTYLTGLMAQTSLPLHEMPTT